MRVEEIPLKAILVKDRFREDLGDVTELAETMRERGLIQPISVDTNNRLLAGGRRLAAAELLGWHSISCVVHPTKTKLDALNIELLENVQRKDMTWVERSKLEKRIFDVRSDTDPRWTQRKQAEMLDVSNGAVARRLTMAESFGLLPELMEYQTEDEAWKVLKRLEEEVVVTEMQKRVPPEVRTASKWAEDHYRVGDAFLGMSQVKNDQVHFAEVDPPYGVELERRKDRNKTQREKMEDYDEIDADEYMLFYEKLAREVLRILRPDSFGVFWFGPTWHSETRDMLRKVGFGVPDIPCIWYKGPVGQTASPDTTMGSCYEPFWLARKGKPKLVRAGRDNVFDFRKLAGTKKIHATEKPLELMQEILASICFPGSRIMVPFLGSGVTLRAAYSLGHTGFGWDMSERHKELFLRKVRGEVADDDAGE